MKIEILLDSTNPQHVSFYNWKQSITDQQLFDIILCGYNIVHSGLLDDCIQKQDVSFENLKKEHEEQVESIRMNYEKEIEIYRNKIQGLTEQWLSKWEMLVKESHTKEQQTCEQWIMRYENVNKEYKEYIKGHVDNSKDAEIQELKAELAVLKTTNAYKGDIGEKSIRDVLMKHFLGYEIKDTSSQQGMSDIHLVDRDGSIIAIESKNKAVVSAQDVNKSMNDIKTLKTRYGEKFVGYMFVSIQSNNIPKKGDLCFEMVEGVPVIWYGSQDSTIFEIDMVKLVRLLYMHKAYHVDVNDMSNHINEYLKKISETKKAIDSLNSSMTCMKNNIISLQGSLEWMYTDMLEVTGTTSLHMHICPHCQQKYKRKGDMERHISLKHSLPC